MNFCFFVVFGRFWFPFSGFLVPEWHFLQATRGLWEFSGNSSGISGDSSDSGDSGEMGEAGAPRTPLPHALGARMTVVHTNSLK